MFVACAFHARSYVPFKFGLCDDKMICKMHTSHSSHHLAWDYDSPMANIINTNNNSNISSDRNQYGDTYYAFHFHLVFAQSPE